MPDLELTVKQAAKALRTSERTVRRWLGEGKLLGRRVDRRDGRKQLPAEWRVSAESVRKLSAKAPADTALRTLPADTPADSVAADLLGEVRSLREENAEYRSHLERLTVAVDALTRALPPAQEERDRLEQTLRDTTDALTDLRATVDRQAEENTRLREELAQARRPWWQRIAKRGGEPR